MRFGRALWVTCVLGCLSGGDERGAGGWQVRLESGEAHVRLPLPPGLPADATFTARWLTPANEAYGERRVTLDAGARVAEFTTSSPWHQAARQGKTKEVLWHRLAYTVSAAGGEVASGIVGISTAASNLFDLEVNTSLKVSPGDEHSLLVRARHPQTGRTLPGVALTLSERAQVVARGVTDARGWATLTFRVPSDREEWEPVLEGRHGDVVVPVKLEFEIDPSTEARLQFDKPLYQPGQTIRGRGILWTRSGRAAAGREARIEVEDPQGRTVLDVRRKANRFGVVAFDAPLAEASPTGHYRVKVRTGDEPAAWWHRVEVSRYELPTLRLEAEAGQSYVLQGQPVMVKGRAVLMDGHPLANAPFRAVWANQKQPQAVEGVTNAKGEFSLRLPALPTRSWRWHWTLEETALVAVTDPGTNRRAEKAVGVRVASQPIFVSAARAELLGGTPREFYVMTTYADGAPAATTVDVFEVSEEAGKQLRTTVKTNARGLARVPALRLRYPGEPNTVLRLEARDAIERKGKEDVFVSNNVPPVEIVPARTLLEPGHALDAEVRAPAGMNEVEFGIWADQRLIHAEVLTMKNGRTGVRVAYRGEFRNEVTLSARPLTGDGEAQALYRTVLYPDRRDLKVSLTTDRESYRPGEAAQLAVNVSSKGHGEPAAVGVAITDTAVDEVAAQRQRGYQYVWSPWAPWQSLQQQLATYFDQPGTADEDLQLAAAYLASSRFAGWLARLHHNTSFYAAASVDLFAVALEAETASIRSKATAYFAQHAEYPADDAAFAPEVQLSQLHDPWRRPFRLLRTQSGAYSRVKLQALGADGVFDTDDDFTVWEAQWSYFEPHRRELVPVPRELAKLPPQSEAALAAELQKQGVPWQSWKDPWGRSHYWVYRRAFGPGPRQLLRLRATPDAPERVVETGVRVKHIYRLLSRGAKAEEPGDDFIVHEFELEEAATLAQLPALRNGDTAATGGGGLLGAVRDPTGASVPGAAVSAVNANSGRRFDTVSDLSGYYALSALPTGVYTLEVTAPGFQTSRVERVVVVGDEWTTLDAELHVAALAETVTVTAEAPHVTTLASSVSESRKNALTAVRLRHHFPETLLWEPLLETDANGRLTLPFTLADSITTWKITAWASTEDGRLAEAVREIRATQPVAIEFQPPEVLTQGDRIELPATLRNHTGAAREFAVDWSGDAGWASVTGALRTKAKAHAAATVPVPLAAGKVMEASAIRVKAISGAAGDSIERKIRVKPHGREVNEVASAFVTRPTVLKVNVPAEWIEGSATLELALYPDMLAHLDGALRGLMVRPYGCGEQTISTTFIHVMMLQHLQQRNMEASEVRARATANLESGLRRLAAFRTAEGGVAYWDNATADPSLTAYALQLWREAREFAAVEPAWITAAERYLRSLKGKNVLVSRLLGDEPEVASDEPAMLAHAILSGPASPARRDALRRLLVTNVRTRQTLFYSVGRIAELEDDALAVQALHHASRWPDVDANAIAEQIQRRATTLMLHRDRWGSWYNTQTTRQVLKALMALEESSGPSGGARFQLKLNGRAVAWSAGERTVDLRQHLAGAGEYRLEVEPEPGSPPFLVQLGTTCYVPWSQTPKGAFDFEVEHSTLTPAVGEPVTTRVKYVRNRLGGMLTAEIGLPPGAVVEEESLRQEGVFRFEIWPDRVVLYLWPWTPAVQNVAFRWRPRFRLEAHAASSSLTDFYNPEEKSEAAPARFAVR